MGIRSKALKNTFKGVYSSPNDKELRGKSYKLARFTSFLGLPNELGTTVENTTNGQLHVLETELTWARVFKNFIGYPKTNVNPFMWWMKFVVMPVVAIWHLALIPFKTARNIVRLITEFLPILCINLLNTVEEESLPRALFIVSILFFTFLKFVGRAITSPIDNASWCLNQGNDIKEEKTLLGISLMLLSLTLTASFYIVFLPMIIHAIAINFPALTMQIGSFLARHFPILVNAGASVLSSPMVQGLGAFLVSSSEAIVGLAVITDSILLAGLFLWKAGETIIEKCCGKRKVHITGGAQTRNDIPPAGNNVSRALSTPQEPGQRTLEDNRRYTPIIEPEKTVHGGVPVYDNNQSIPVISTNRASTFHSREVDVLVPESHGTHLPSRTTLTGTV